MAQKIKIRNIETKEGDNAKGHWQNFIITGEDGSKTSTFDTSASVLKEGDTIEAEIEMKGKYANIKSFKVIEHGVPLLKPDTGGKTETKDPTRKSIERQKSLDFANQRALAMFQSGKFDKATPEETIKTAQKFEHYLETGNVPESKIEKEVKIIAGEAP